MNAPINFTRKCKNLINKINDKALAATIGAGSTLGTHAGSATGNARSMPLATVSSPRSTRNAAAKGLPGLSTGSSLNSSTSPGIHGSRNLACAMVQACPRACGKARQASTQRCSSMAPGTTG